MTPLLVDARFWTFFASCVFSGGGCGTGVSWPCVVLGRPCGGAYGAGGAMGRGLTHSFAFAAAFGMGLPPLAGRETVGLEGTFGVKGVLGPSGGMAPCGPYLRVALRLPGKNMVLRRWFELRCCLS